MSFLFEYIGEMGKDYIHSVVTCLEDALTDRDLVHRQTAGSIVKHLALGTAGLGNEDALLHLMNLIWPNVFESGSNCSFVVEALADQCITASPHVIGTVLDAIEAMRVALGPGIVLSHVLQGLWHPARKVREVSPLFSLISICRVSLCDNADVVSSQVYWQIYASLYMGAQDALVRSSFSRTCCAVADTLRQVAFYPNIPDLSDERNYYERDVLYMWI